MLAALLHSDARAMPSDGAGPLAENFARILSERASFELREEDVHAYRRRLSSLQHAVQVSAAARAQEDEEYRQWQVSGGPSGRTAAHLSPLAVLPFVQHVVGASMQAVRGVVHPRRAHAFISHCCDEVLAQHALERGVRRPAVVPPVRRRSTRRC